MNENYEEGRQQKDTYENNKKSNNKGLKIVLICLGVLGGLAIIFILIFGIILFNFFKVQSNEEKVFWSIFNKESEIIDKAEEEIDNSQNEMEESNEKFYEDEDEYEIESDESEQKKEEWNIRTFNGDYEVVLDYDAVGYVNKVTIR